MSSLPNPYVGPRAYEKNETLYGREREIRQLKALLIAERVVLLHSPSGAGKTSLIQAGLLPRMADEAFQILPIVRLNLTPPEELTGANRYRISALLSLEEPLDIAQRIPLPELADIALEDYLERRYRPENSSPNELIVFDQFEEILTIAPADREGKLDFFEQLGAALRSRSRWALFSMREDYVAALAPYLRPLPKRLSSTFRLDLLGKDAAREAIQKPAQSAGIDFTGPAAEKLVEDLSQIQVQNPDGKMESQPGLTVEPVQLQVVCYRLWHALPDDDREIGVDDVSAQGSVDDSLADYYAQTAMRVATETFVSERDIREWFEKKLITPEGVRGQVLKRAGASDGLDNRAIDQLENAHVIRSEKRAGSTWYELSHDRLIDPIRKNNAVWSQFYLKLYQRQAKLWAEEGRPERLLLVGLDLLQAEAEAAGDFRMTADERAFLKDSRDAQKRADRDLKRTRLITALAIGASVALLVVLAALVVALRLYQRATAAEKTAVEEQATAVQSANNAAVAEQVAKIQASVAATNAAEAQKQKALAEEKAKHARAGELVSFSSNQRDHQFSLSLLLAVEAFRIADTTFTRGLLLDNTQSHTHFIDELRGHTNSVTSIAYSPDGKILASASADKTIMLWDVNKRQQIGASLIGHKEIVNSIAFSPDGKILASGSDDKNIILWDVASHQPIGKPLQGFARPIEHIAFSPDGKTLASAGDYDDIYLWDIVTHQSLGQLNAGLGYGSLIAFSPNGELLAFMRADGSIQFWDMVAHQLSKLYISGDSLGITSIAFSPDDKILVSGTYDGKIIFFDSYSRERIGQAFTGQPGQVWSVAFSPDGKTLASGSYDNTITLWDVGKQKPLGKPLTGHSAQVLEVAFSPDGKTLASASADHTIIIWDLAGHQSLLSGIEINYRVSFNSDLKILPSENEENTIKYWDLITHESISHPLEGHPSGINGISYGPDGKIIAMGIGQTIVFWDVAKSQPSGQPLVGHKGEVRAVVFSPDGKILASGGDDKALILWDMATRQPIGQPLEGHSAAIRTLAFSPDGKVLASGSDDKMIVLWDVASGKPIGPPLVGHIEGVRSVTFSPDGKILASGSEDKTIILWDIATRHPIGLPLSGHTSGVTRVAFSPDSKTLASESYDSYIYRQEIIWDVDQHQPIGQSFNGYPGDEITGGGGSNSGFSYSGWVSGTIYLWDKMNPQFWIEDSCQRAGRNLTQSEWKQYFPGESYRKTCALWPDGQ